MTDKQIIIDGVDVSGCKKLHWDIAPFLKKKKNDHSINTSGNVAVGLPKHIAIMIRIVYINNSNAKSKNARNTSNYLMNLIKEFQIVLKFTIVLS